MTEAQTLLAEFVTTGSESAFRELVSRYLDLVYSTAVRRVDGDSHLAEDIAQTVFMDLARMARGLSKGVMLGGWLHQHTCHVAATLLRSERRRQARERHAMELNALRGHSEPDLARLAPLLDEVIGQLGKEDRDAILLRFFEQRDFRSVGEAMGTKEDAARMRVSRALEKLHALLVQRGVSISVAALGTALATQAVTAAPAGLAAAIAGTALAGGAAAGAASGTLFKLIAMTKLKAGIASAVILAGLATPLVLSHQSQARLRRENQSLRDTLEQLGQVAAESERLSNLVTVAQNSRADAHAEQDELLRLRGEVGLLKRQLAENAKAQRQLARQAVQAGQSTDLAEKQRQEALMQDAFIAKMSYAKNWMLAFHMYAQQNEGKFPADFSQAASFLTDGGEVTLLATNQFDILYHGSFNALTNPATVIVLRENQTFPSPSGGWNRTYGFADGHSEVHKSQDGNFEAWEAQHLVASPGGGQSGQ